MGGINTLGHIDISTEALNINYSASGNFVGDLSMVGTTTIFKGNQDDKKIFLLCSILWEEELMGVYTLFFPSKKKKKAA